ncbi:Krev interaction trapped protein 1 [Nowakowskiella sp. JEL0078]|nr:Krev interaction trapped protein 1 [Nowakowskiella sp. JEL0078]
MDKPNETKNTLHRKNKNGSTEFSKGMGSSELVQLGTSMKKIGSLLSHVSLENLKSEAESEAVAAPEGASRVMKFKSTAAENHMGGVVIGPATDEWRPPIQRHLTKNGEIHHVTIRVRIFAGDEIHDFNSKFVPGSLTTHSVFEAIARKEDIPKEGRKLFALWIVGRDLELQLRPNLNRVEKYTHYPEAANPKHPINKYWVVFKREALVSKQLERKITDEVVIKLLYGEAKHNVLIGRYVCTPNDAVTLAALQLQSSQGDLNTNRHKAGFMSKENILAQYIPSQLLKIMRPDEWESLIFTEYSKYTGKTTPVARMLYLQYVRQWSHYGMCYFPICQDVPPGGFFEFRIVQLLLGIGAEGVAIIDMDKYKVSFEQMWEKISWIGSKETILIKYMAANGKGQNLRLISPQSLVINNICMRANHILKKAVEDIALQRDMQRTQSIRNGANLQERPISFNPDKINDTEEIFEAPKPAEFEVRKISRRKSSLPGSKAFSGHAKESSIRRANDSPLPFEGKIANIVEGSTMNLSNLVPEPKIDVHKEKHSNSKLASQDLSINKAISVKCNMQGTQSLRLSTTNLKTQDFDKNINLDIGFLDPKNLSLDLSTNSKAASVKSNQEMSKKSLIPESKPNEMSEIDRNTTEKTNKRSSNDSSKLNSPSYSLQGQEFENTGKNFTSPVERLGETVVPTTLADIGKKSSRKKNARISYQQSK